MRIATWNLERGGRSARARAAQETVLCALRADVLVLTEPGPSYNDGPGVVTSTGRRPDQRGNEAWVAIVGPTVEPVTLDIPFGRMAVRLRGFTAQQGENRA